MVVLVAALVAGVVIVLVATNRLGGGGEPPPPAVGFEVPQLNVAPGAAVPTATAVAPAEVSLEEWAGRLSDKTQIPVRVLMAYANAEVVTRETTPGCNLSWATLAGVGRVESHHGRYNGTRIAEDGTLEPPIIGIPLDGSPGIRAVPDTDGGRLDGDTQWDRAVGSMQFLPTTWARWGARASEDGEAPDPQNVDDAALGAARYLCSWGWDLTSAEGWWEAVFNYNNSTAYGRDVFSGADAYAKAAATL